LAKKKHNRKLMLSNKKTDNETLILFRCTTCNFEENIPKSVVDFFDIMDDGDTSVPPRFDCQACSSGLMQPVNYTNNEGISYRL